MSEILGKVLWRLYLYIILVSVGLLALGTKFLWDSIVSEVRTELIYANNIISKSLSSLLNKDAALIRLTTDQLLELGLSKDNPEAIKLLDDLLANNRELLGITIANPQGEVQLATSNIQKAQFPNFLAKAETENAFNKALNTDSLVMGRTYFSSVYNDWVVPLHLRIKDHNQEVVAVFSNAIKLYGDNSPFENNYLQGSVRVSVVKANHYFQFASFIDEKSLEALFSEPIQPIYLDMFNKALVEQTGYTSEELKTQDLGIQFMEYANHNGELLMGAFSYDMNYGHFIFTNHKKAALIQKLKAPLAWLSSLLLLFNLILFMLFKYLSKLQRESKVTLEYQSQHDQLTSLPNLYFLTRNFNQWKKTNGSVYSVVFIDLDNFKINNDIHGHPVGDKILIEVAKRLQSFFINGLCVRQGGDEFIVIIPEVDKEKVANLCQDFLLNLKLPIQVRELEFSIRASIGIARSPNDDLDNEGLFRKADIAMYEAKRRKCGVFVFTEQLEIRNARNATISKELNHALLKNEFSLVYQPQIEVNTNQVIGIEVLLRWHNETLKNVSPAEFIPIAEHTGAILDISDFVFAKAFEEFLEIYQQVIKNNSKYNHNNKFRLAINVSILHLSSKGFLDRLFKLFEQYQCEYAMLMLEVTETLIINNLDKIGGILKQVKQSGIEISLDDFGTGYSSMSYLTRLPINEIKIDQSFVQGLADDTNKSTLVKSIINLGENLDVKVLAEGVETDEQLDLLKEYNCKYVQGYYFSKPLDKISLLKYLKDYSAATTKRSMSTS